MVYNKKITCTPINNTGIYKDNKNEIKVLTSRDSNIKQHQIRLVVIY